MEPTAAPTEKDRRTTVWLVRHFTPFHIFYCFSCTRPLFKYQGSIAMVVPSGETQKETEFMKFPFVIVCRGKHLNKFGNFGKCPAEYIIEGFTE